MNGLETAAKSGTSLPGSTLAADNRISGICPGSERVAKRQPGRKAHQKFLAELLGRYADASGVHDGSAAAADHHRQQVIKLIRDFNARADRPNLSVDERGLIDWELKIAWREFGQTGSPQTGEGGNTTLGELPGSGQPPLEQPAGAFPKPRGPATEIELNKLKSEAGSALAELRSATGGNAPIPPEKLLAIKQKIRAYDEAVDASGSVAAPLKANRDALVREYLSLVFKVLLKTLRRHLCRAVPHMGRRLSPRHTGALLGEPRIIPGQSQRILAHPNRRPPPFPQSRQRKPSPYRFARLALEVR